MPWLASVWSTSWRRSVSWLSEAKFAAARRSLQPLALQQLRRGGAADVLVEGGAAFDVDRAAHLDQFERQPALGELAPPALAREQTHVQRDRRFVRWRSSPTRAPTSPRRWRLSWRARISVGVLSADAVARARRAAAAGDRQSDQQRDQRRRCREGMSLSRIAAALYRQGRPVSVRCTRYRPDDSLKPAAPQPSASVTAAIAVRSASLTGSPSRPLSR